MHIKPIILLLSCLTLPCIASSGKVLAPGVFYFHEQVQKPFPLSIHLLQVDPQQAEILLEPSHGVCCGAETPSSIAERTNAIAVINGGYFTFGQSSKLKDLFIKILDCCGYDNYDAYPEWMMKVQDHWFSISDTDTPLLAWTRDGKDVAITTGKNEAFLMVESLNLPIADLNKPYANGPILYSPNYGQNTPKDDGVEEFIFRNGVLVDNNVGGGTHIHHDAIIYAIKESDAKHYDLDSLELGMQASVIGTVYTSDPIAAKDWHFVRGTKPLLIRDGQIPEKIMTATSSFYTKRHPRTAVGILNDNSWLFIVVDGRNQHSDGLTLPELASLMLQLGCIQAVNLGGGGDSTMVIEGAVVNVPSGRQYSLVQKERPLSDAFVIMPYSSPTQ